MTLNYATGLDLGKRKREQGGINEDSISVTVLENGNLDLTTNTGIFVLADGAGGAQAGEIASYIAATEVSRRLTEQLLDARRLERIVDTPDTDSNPGDTATAQTKIGSGSDRLLDQATIQSVRTEVSPDWVLGIIETAIQATHTRLLQLIDELELDSAYTTILAGIKVGDRFCYGWVGDSRAYVVNLHRERADDERIVQLTRDHSVVQRLLDQGEIDEVEAHVHPHGNRVTRALGGTADEDPAQSVVGVETGDIKLFADDVILLTSDGLIDAYSDAPQLHDKYLESSDPEPVKSEILEKSVTDREIMRVIMGAETLENAVDRFVDIANDRGGKDNISLILAQDSGLEEASATDIPNRSYRANNVPVGKRDTVTRDPEYE